MKLLSYRDRDRVHLTDMIEVGLIGREMLAALTPELAKRLEALLVEARAVRMPVGRRGR